MSTLGPGTPTAADEEPIVVPCARHPKVETALRCGRCGTPICPKCMVPTPVGARCRTCARVKRIVLVGKPVELARATLMGLAVAAVGAVLLTYIPFLGLIGLAFLGFLVGEVVSQGVNRKRGGELGALAVACLLVGYVLGLVGLFVVTRGMPLAFAPLLVMGLLSNLGLLLGLGIGALLAWMRVR